MDEEAKKVNRRIEKLERRVTSIEDFKPTFYGFTGGIRDTETMAEFIKRVNMESGR